MELLVVSATKLEIEPFLSSKSCDTLITGVGIPAAIYHLTKRLLQKKYGLVIQAGIAGSFTGDINPAEVVAVSKDIFGDAGVEESGKFKSIFGMGLADRNEFPFHEEWLENNSDILIQLSIKKVKAVTLNKLSDSGLQKDQLLKNFQPEIESMEGAAFHYVCLQQNIQFIQLRSISNDVGERDKTKWKMKEAIENLNTELKKLVDSIQKQ